ncbi:hypothetical protein BU26DRAFT_564951 [Trematosphaeria pertusa]|uniref:Uncharacterized protein n=1 Tax=Trematosphaeria pertusa TaxID=390896 RepID=A0A6A6IGY7_9PLEO|nr:uncharacterized protein BU26DRAFT_564951 [Trematosphaeria pertusa]KAF2249298.1 hypothetical protein BU26DRAFT_564951 [Trematosphaeria pertusa]
MATISNRPLSSFNWADDDDDEWDFDQYMAATADLAPPTLEELGPLQRPLQHEDLEPPLLLAAEPADAVAPSLPLDARPPPAFKLPGSHAAYFSPHPADWPTGEEQPSAHWRRYDAMVNEVPGPPAYKEMSVYEDGVVMERKRVNYYANWRDMKVQCGKTTACETMLLKSSSLKKEVRFQDDQDGEDDGEKEDTPLLTRRNTEEDLGDLVMTPPDSPIVGGVKEDVGSVAEIAALIDQPSTVSDDAISTDVAVDEDTDRSEAADDSLDSLSLGPSSRPTTPNSEAGDNNVFDKAFECASIVGISAASTFATRTYTLQFTPSAGSTSEDDADIDVTFLEPDDRASSLELVHTPATPTVETESFNTSPASTRLASYLPGKMALDWWPISVSPWKATGFIATAAIIGAVVARRR